MSYENTHLWAADGIRARIRNQALHDVITKGLDYYFLGAVFPDTCSYSSDPEIRKVSDRLHGETGIPTNKVVFDVLDRVIRTRDDKNFDFICGYLTHMALDIVFHPLVVYFSGYLPQQNPSQAAKSSYLHWHYETFIDKHLNNAFYLERMIKSDIVRNLVIPSVLDVPEEAVVSALKRQISFFRRVNSRFFYWIYRTAVAAGVIDRKYLGGFYANLDANGTQLPQKIQYRDLFSGETTETTLNDLMERSLSMGTAMIQAAYAYYTGKVSRQDCSQTIVGHGLDTGRSGKPRQTSNLPTDKPGSMGHSLLGTRRADIAFKRLVV